MRNRDMDKVECERMVADAILLERAAGVLTRRRPDPRWTVYSVRERHDTAIWVLKEKAAELRREAESYVPPR